MKKTPKAPEWPRARRWFASEHPAWVVMEPARLAPVGGTVFALFAMLIYFMCQLQGLKLSATKVAVGVALVFVIAYAATGLLVYYVLRLREPEVPSEDGAAAVSERELNQDADEAH